MLLVTSIQACSSSVADQPSSVKPSGENLGVIEIHVRNFGDVNAHIYALYRGGRTRLGTLRTTSAMDKVRVFVVDWSTPEELQLGVNLDRGRNCLTPPVSVVSGDVIDFQVPERGGVPLAPTTPNDRYKTSDSYRQDMDAMICTIMRVR
jgi:hypothetical protein